MILRSAGFVTNALIGGKNMVNFAYILYLRGRDEGMSADEIEHMVRRWFVMTMLTGRYAGTPESAFDFDIRQVEVHGTVDYTSTVIKGELSEGFWSTLLPQNLETSSSISPYFLVYQAAQVKLNDKGFLSRDITVQDLIKNRSDVHHLFPRQYLKDLGFQRGQYNQIANYVLAQSEINIAIGSKAPSVYFTELCEQCQGGKKKYGGITDMDELKENLGHHAIPEGIFNSLADDYDNFLAERRKLMAAKLKTYFERL
jgi:hypothetical protein